MGTDAAKSDAAAQKSGLALAGEKVLQVLDNDVLRQMAAKLRQSASACQGASACSICCKACWSSLSGGK